MIVGFELPPEHLVELLVDEHDPDIVLWAIGIDCLELHQDPMEDLTVLDLAEKEGLYDIKKGGVSETFTSLVL